MRGEDGGAKKRRVTTSASAVGGTPFTGIDATKLGYRCTEHVATDNATHVVLKRPE
jgi:hypothetical protein